MSLFGNQQTAVISDVHGNDEALKAVIADIDKRKIPRIVCLGDTLGYGPSPVECLQIVMERCEFSILGNHDQAALYDPEHFNPRAYAAIMWTRKVLERSKKADVYFEYLNNMPTSKKEGEILWVHASPQNHTSDYVFPGEMFNAPKMKQRFALVDKVCLHGHTHLPGIAREIKGLSKIIGEGDDSILGDDVIYFFSTPEDLPEMASTAGAEKMLVNVGSVGQPRDHNPSASYVILESDKILFVRVPYEIEKITAKFKLVPLLDPFLYQRLTNGR